MARSPIAVFLAPPPPNDGGLGSEQAALVELVRRLVEGLRPRQVYLFGSRAEGRARPDSDFDLLVVLDDDTPEDDANYEAVYAPLLGSGIGADVIPSRLSEFQAVMSDPTDPWRQSWSRARKLYERP